jgi:hypothetical protein
MKYTITIARSVVLIYKVAIEATTESEAIQAAIARLERRWPRAS